MEKARYCKKHPKFYIQWLRFLKENVEFGCIKCQDEVKRYNQNQDEVQDRTDILYLPEIIENPNIIIPHLPIGQQIINFYDNLTKFSEEELEKYYQPFEMQLVRLKELLENLIQIGRENLEKFKEKCKESRQQLYQELKIEEIAQLIKELEVQSNEDQSVQDQIQKKLVDIKQQLHEDLMREQSSKFKKILNDVQLTIYKFNLNCNKQINEISAQINQYTENLKQYFNKSFNAIYNANTQFDLFTGLSQQKINPFLAFNENQAPVSKLLQETFPYYRSYILPQYYLDYILKQGDIYSMHQSQLVQQYYAFTPTNQDILKGGCFWKFNTSNQLRAKLFIFKSNNNGNPIFGYFKNDMREFIFSFTHNEIYPKNKQLQINQQQNRQDYGMNQSFRGGNQVQIQSYFGGNNNMICGGNNNMNQGILGGNYDMNQSVIGGNSDMNQSFIVGKFDMQIYANLIDGQSNLGSEFVWDSQNDDIEKTTYLFGGAKPNIQICELFYF